MVTKGDEKSERDLFTIFGINAQGVSNALMSWVLVLCAGRQKDRG